MFIFLAIVFTVVIGLFIGSIFTTNMRGWKKRLVTLVIATCAGCGISAMFCVDRFKLLENLRAGISRDL